MGVVAALRESAGGELQEVSPTPSFPLPDELGALGVSGISWTSCLRLVALSWQPFLVFDWKVSVMTAICQSVIN